jgi:kynureninase
VTPTDTQSSGYFLYHSVGQYPRKQEDMARGFARFATAWSAWDDGQWHAALEMRDAFLEHWARLINVSRNTLTATENVTTALFSLIGSLPESTLRGRKVLVGADCFPSLHFLLAGLADRLGFSLQTVPLRPGENWVRDEDFVAHWGADVGVTLLTWVTSTSSHRCDHRALVTHGRRHDTIIGIDVTQGIGLLPFDASDPAVDFTVSTSLKWLCGAPGAGILHVRSERIGAFEPELRGWFSQENPFSWDLDRFSFAPDARRFDHGTPSVVACAGTLPALEWHARQDQSAMLAHNRALTRQLIENLRTPALTLVSPDADDQRGGSVMIRLAPVLQPAEVLSRLRAEDLYADCRGSILRLSPGIITGEEQVARLIRVMTR